MRFSGRRSVMLMTSPLKAIPYHSTLPWISHFIFHLSQWLSFLDPQPRLSLLHWLTSPHILSVPVVEVVFNVVVGQENVASWHPGAYIKTKLTPKSQEKWIRDVVWGRRKSAKKTTNSSGNEKKIKLSKSLSGTRPDKDFGFVITWHGSEQEEGKTSRNLKSEITGKHYKKAQTFSSATFTAHTCQTQSVTSRISTFRWSAGWNYPG